MENVEASAPVSGPIELFGLAWQEYKKRFAVLTGISVVFSLSSIFQVFINWQAVAFGGLGLWLLILALYVVFAILAAWAMLAFVQTMRAEPGLGLLSAFAGSKGLIVSLILASIIAVLVTLLGLVALIIPAIMFAVYSTFYMFVIGEGEYRGLNALVRSKQYVIDHWWGTLGRTILVSLVTGIITGLISFVARLLFAGFGDPIAFGALVGVIVGLFTTPYTYVYLYTYYRQLKKEKGDMPLEPTESRVAYLLFRVKKPQS